MHDRAENRFESDADRYAAYLETPEGRLRADLTFANLRDFLPATENQSLRALDLGCGTGAGGVRMAQLGVHVTLLDSSAAMLSLAERAIAESDLGDRVTIRHGDAGRLTAIFDPRSFDVITCHNLLEYLDDPCAVLRAVARLMRGQSAVLSLLVRGQAGEVLKAALVSGDLAAANRNLAQEWGRESLYGGKVRLFTLEAMEEMVRKASLEVIARRGVRVVSDYLPAQISRSAEYERIFHLERVLSARQEFLGVARYMHYLVRPVMHRAQVDA